MAKIFADLRRFGLPIKKGAEEFKASQRTSKLVGNLGNHLSHGPQSAVPGNLLLHFLEAGGIGKDKDITNLLSFRPLDGTADSDPRTSPMVEGDRDLTGALLRWRPEPLAGKEGKEIRRVGVGKGIHGRIAVKRNASREENRHPCGQAFKDGLEKASLPVESAIGPGQVLGKLGNATLKARIGGDEGFGGRLEGEKGLTKNLLPLLGRKGLGVFRPCGIRVLHDVFPG
jgi:hypothetical protein